MLRFNHACDAHDGAATSDLLADDVVFEPIEPAPDGQRSSGKAAVVAVLAP